jgi:hypothetical protein
VEGSGRVLSLRYSPGICLEALRRTTKNINQDSRSPGRDLYPGLPEHEGVLTTRPRRSVRHYDVLVNGEKHSRIFNLEWSVSFPRTGLDVEGGDIPVPVMTQTQ